MQALTLLQRFNVWLDATVSVNPDGHMIVTDATQIKTYWDKMRIWVNTKAEKKWIEKLDLIRMRHKHFLNL